MGGYFIIRFPALQRFLFERKGFAKHTCERFMIFFYCPECGEELEAEEAIKGSRMKCPACWKEIMVPRTGAPVLSRREPRYGPADREPKSSSGGWLPVAVVALLAIAAIGGGVGFLVTRGGSGPDPAVCAPCKGTGKAVCADCRGAESFPCEGRCKGTGTVKSHVSGEDTPCPDCGGLGTRACPRCDGHGYVGCNSCRGTGRPPEN